MYPVLNIMHILNFLDRFSVGITFLNVNFLHIFLYEFVLVIYLNYQIILNLSILMYIIFLDLTCYFFNSIFDHYCSLDCRR